MMQDLKKYQVYEENQQQNSINEQPNQMQQMQKKQITKFDNDKKNDLNSGVQIFQRPQQLKSLNLSQNSRNSSFHEIHENLNDKLQNNKQNIQFDNHVEKLQKNQMYRRHISYKSLGNGYTNSDGGSLYEQRRQANLSQDNQNVSINKQFNEYSNSQQVQFGEAQNKVYYHNLNFNEMYKKKQDQLSCSFYSKNVKKNLIKSNQIICQRQIKEEQDHNDSSESNKSRVSKNISELQDYKDQQSKYEEIQSLRISKISKQSDQMINDLDIEKIQGIENSLGSDIHYFDSNKSSIIHTPQMKSLKDIKLNKNQVPSLKIEKQDNAKYLSQASSPLHNNQERYTIRKNPLQIMIDSSGCFSNLVSPKVTYIDSGQHKNTMSFGKQQEYNSFQKTQQKFPIQNIVPFNQKSPINEESKSFEFNLKNNRKENKQKQKQIGQEQKINVIKSQSEKKQQTYEYEKKIKELEQELKLKEQQIQYKDDIIREQLQKIQFYNHRINQIPNEDDWNSDFHNIIEFIDDYQRNIYQLISNKNSNISFILLMKQKFQEQYQDKFNKFIKMNSNQKNQQRFEQQTHSEIISIQKHQILLPIFENMIILQQKSIIFGFEFGHAIPEIFQKLFTLSKREKFRNRLLDMSECLKYEIQELINFLNNHKQNQNINQLKEALESEIIIQKYIYQTIFNISNLFKERIMQIQEGHKQMQEQLKKNTLYN